MSDKITIPKDLFRDLAEKMVAQFNQRSNLATDIVRMMDLFQDGIDMAGEKYDPALEERYKNWNDPLASVTIRHRLWTMFGAGEECYDSLMAQCRERGYSQLRVFCATVWMMELIKGAQNE